MFAEQLFYRDSFLTRKYHASDIDIYDGVTTQLHADHPHLQFAAMCWTGTAPEHFKYFLNQSNHRPGTPWPPALITYHMYGGAAAVLPGVVPTERLIAQGGVSDTANIVRLVDAMTRGATKVYIDELGYGGDPPINYTLTLEGGGLRAAYQSPRAAWFVAAWAQLAAIGVEAMGFSQFYGFPFGTGAGSPTYAHSNT